MEMKFLQNGLKTSQNRKKRKSRKKRNGGVSTTATKSATPKRRNGVTKTSVAAYLKKNGQKAVSRTSQNRKKRKKSKRSKNGLTTVTRTARNGFLGNTKNDAMQVAGVIAGAAVTQMVGGFINRFASPYAASFGFGQYSGLIAKGVTALFVVPKVAEMVTRKNDIKSFARIGGLVVFGIDLINQFFPQISLNPFSTSPVVLANGQALLTPSGAVGLAAAAGADSNTVNKMAGAINAVASGVGSPSGYPTYQNPIMESEDNWN